MSGSGKSLLSEIYDRPGFKIRRCHQIAISIFYDECRELDLTTTQFGTLVVLRAHPGIDQITVARLLGLDRSTTATVVSGLEARGLITRTTHPGDRRKRELNLTPAAHELLRDSREALDRAQKRLLSPLTPEQRVAFIEALDRLLETFNEVSRVPLEPEERILQERAAGTPRRRRTLREMVG